MKAGGRSESSGKGAVWQRGDERSAVVFGTWLNKVEIGLVKSTMYVSYGVECLEGREWGSLFPYGRLRGGEYWYSCSQETKKERETRNTGD